MISPLEEPPTWGSALVARTAAQMWRKARTREGDLGVPIFPAALSLLCQVSLTSGWATAPSQAPSDLVSFALNIVLEDEHYGLSRLLTWTMEELVN